MGENLPYDEESRNDLWLPAEEEAWQKMKALLDREDKRRRVLPLWVWRYGLSGLLLVGLATAGYFLQKQKEDNKINISQIIKLARQQQREKATITQATPDPTTKTNSKNKNGPLVPAAENKEAQNKTIRPDATILINKVIENEQRLKRMKPMQQIESGKVKKPFNKELLAQRDKIIDAKSYEKEQIAVKVLPNRPSPSYVPKASNVTQPKPDSLRQIINSLIDSTRGADTAKTLVAPPVVSTGPKKEKARKGSGFRFSAGLGMQQPISFNGQALPAFDSAGKRTGFFEHIPFVYLRLQKGVWSLQGEFHYRVSQPVKSFAFEQTTSYDVMNATLHTERLLVQKLYYRQAVLSLHRFVLPAWSVGMGGTYNILLGAVTEQETKNKNAFTGRETMSKSLATVKGYTDSFLYKSTAGVLLQTDYQWKRFSVGLRYTKNLQPFIKYTQPGGAVSEEKNSVLQAVLRFRLVN